MSGQHGRDAALRRPTLCHAQQVFLVQGASHADWTAQRAIPTIEA